MSKFILQEGIGHVHIIITSDYMQYKLNTVTMEYKKQQ